MTTLIASSVVRGTHQGESHGGVFLVDFTRQSVTQVIDWNTVDIDWQGRGWDRGLRGIAFDGERVFVAASNELFVYTPDFKLLGSYRNRFLMHCHEICVYQRRLYLTSTGFDTVLGFDLDSNRFCFGLHLVAVGSGYQGAPFDPETEQGPAAGNQLHINNVFCDTTGMYISGLKTAGMMRFDGRTLIRLVSLPRGIHNARPFGDGVVYNDTPADRVRVRAAGKEISFAVPAFDESRLTHTDLDDSRIARAGFGRGLCVLDDKLIAAGSSPSTIALHNLAEVKTVSVVTLTPDVRNAIHGLEVWPYS
ncbi:MAG: hypothetical protein H6985_09660 [Pseudomonadales bacterium]|nr:hypothetical protein [Pseudomonadales bacterium]